MSNVTALPTAQKQSFSLSPTNIKEAMEFAAMMAKSSIVPKDYQNNPGNILVAIQWGMELNLQPLQAMQNIAVINGRPSIWGDAMLAIVRGSGLLDSISENISDKGATCTVKRRGEEPVTREFTLEDAAKANLQGKAGPWTQYPKRMMQLRARAFALRDVFPDVLRGIQIAEEAQDMPPETEKNMGAADVVAEPKDKATTVADALAGKTTGPTLDEILKDIKAATTSDALAKAAEKCANLTNPDDKAIARKEYKAKFEALKAAAAGPTYAEIEAQIRAAESVAAVNTAQDLVRSVKDDSQRAELSELAAKRIEELTPKAE